MFTSDYAMPKEKKIEHKQVVQDQTIHEPISSHTVKGSPEMKTESKLGNLPKPKSAIKEASKQVSVMDDAFFFESGSVGPVGV